MREQDLLPKIQLVLANPYMQWLIINCLAWSLALYAAALSIRVFGMVGALIGALLAGAIVGTGQAFLLRHIFPIKPRQWVRSSIVGSLLGILPIGILFIVWVLLTLVTGITWVLLMMGAIFGGILGAVQARLLHPLVFEQAGWWILANLLAGALCAPLSLTGAYFWLPVLCSAGPLLFGIVTGLALRQIIRSEEIG